VADVTAALESYESPLTAEDLPSVPDSFLRVMTEVDAPQPLRHVKNGGGMTVSIGRIQACPVNHVKFVALSHNTIRGAAGGAVLNAELLARDGYLTQSEGAALA
jgi:aspartate-semialdehyde dehydrogenase